LSGNVTIGSVTWLNKSRTGINLNGNTLTVRGNLIFGSEKAFISSTGKIILDGTLSDENKLLTTDNNFSAVDVEINTATKISFIGSMTANSITHSSGTLNLTGSSIEVGTLQAIGPSQKILDLTGASLSGINELNLNSTTLELISDEALLRPAKNSVIDLGSRAFNGKITVSDQGVSLAGNNSIKELVVSGKLMIKGNNTIESLTLNANSVTIIDEGTVQSLSQTTQILSAVDGRASIQAASGKSFLKFDGRYKLCFDYLDITNVDATGDAVINAGLSSTLTNSTNWAKDKCDDILFPDFDIVSNCANGIIQLVDKSGGAINTWLWTTNNTSATLIGETEKNGTLIFPKEGEFEVSLRITNTNDSRTYKKMISVITNDLPSNEIILNGLNLFSTQPADKYEWYKDYTIIQNATGRSYPFNGEPGSYFVLTKGSTCNRISNTILITGVDEYLDPVLASLEIFPNPARHEITLTGISENSTIRIWNASSQLVYDTHASTEVNISVGDWPRGIYFVMIIENQSVVTRKIILR
jgi:PKD repeat protein